MKYLYLSILLLAFSCGEMKKKSNDNDTLKEQNDTKKVVPKIANEQLLVLLKNPNNLTDVKALITNSGLIWDQLAFENQTHKIGIINVPADKKDFWIERLQTSGEFKTVSSYTKENLTSLIKKAKTAFFTFRKTECFGDCPVYEVTIDENGNVIYNGLKYVIETGERKFTLTEKELTTLKEKLTKNNFSSYKKIYNDQNIQDLPSTFITYKDAQVQIRLWKEIPKDLIDVHEYVQGILLDKKLFE